MAVYTQVGFADAEALCSRLGLGALTALRGIEGGIENTNYFVSCDRGEYVLTLFERLGFDELPYYLCLMKHLATHGIPVPEPVADPDSAARSTHHFGPRNAPCEFMFSIHDRPAAMVQRLSGQAELSPGPAHCLEVGKLLARMHLAARDFDRMQPNLRGLTWWNETVPVVLPHLTQSQAALIQTELALQNHVAQSAAYAALPRGAVHADLFRDNVMFARADDGFGEQSTPTLTGVFDFYFAGTDSWLFDIAVALNDWAIDLASGRQDLLRATSLLRGYESVRPLTGAERQLLGTTLRGAALRFWISRLWDFYLPRDAHMLKAHDPAHFERVLRERASAPVTASTVFARRPAMA